MMMTRTFFSRAPLAPGRYAPLPAGAVTVQGASRERLLALRNDVGLLSEEYDTRLGCQLGNTPQAFSMVGLINTARQLTGSHTATSASRRQQRLHGQRLDGWADG